MKAKLLAVTLAATALLSSCSSDDATQINYGIYASPALLAVTNPEVTVTNSDGKTSTWTLDTRDFKIAPDFNITAGNEGMLYWATSDHFDKFGVESTISVKYIPKEGVDMSAFAGQIVMGHGIVGNVLTQNTDGDFYDKPIYKATSAQVFNIPDDAASLQAYLSQLNDNPDVVSISVDGSGVPTVTFK